MTDTNLNELIINKLTKSQYQNLLDTHEIQDTQLYITTDEDSSGEISGLSFPSNRYTDFAAGESGAIYTAPNNGWFAAVLDVTASNGFIILLNESSAFIAHGYWPSAGGQTAAYIPASKGQSVRLTYGGGNISSLKFVYAEGSK